MLPNLHIKNFRMLGDLEISKLGRVNLIVGKNNSGKSTVLEALRLYAGQANPSLLREILLGHDESFNVTQDTDSENQERGWYGLKHLFPNRELPVNDDTYISLTSSGRDLLKLEYIFYYVQEDVETDEDGEIIGHARRRIPVKLSELAAKEYSAPVEPAIRVTVGSGRNAFLNLDDDLRRPSMALLWRGLDEGNQSCSYISTEFLSSNVLAGLWDKITLSPNEEIVLTALKIIDESVERLAFVESTSRYSSTRSEGRLAIVKLKKSEVRIPLNSMGDGMSRILQLILSVFPAKDGFLLIDEFENGLHFSVQEEVWRIIFKLAKKLNIQVFATTHSWDCIESFAKVAVESPEEGVLLKLARSKLTSDNGKVIATVYDENDLQTITASDLEVR